MTRATGTELRGVRAVLSAPNFELRDDNAHEDLRDKGELSVRTQS